MQGASKELLWPAQHWKMKCLPHFNKQEGPCRKRHAKGAWRNGLVYFALGRIRHM
jgi:hypothetical protein